MTYHYDFHFNGVWGEIMKGVGLYPSHNEKPGGRETGFKVSHYVIPGGPFEVACAELLKSGFDISYVEVWHDAQQSKKESKTKSLALYSD